MNFLFTCHIPPITAKVNAQDENSSVFSMKMSFEEMHSLAIKEPVFSSDLEVVDLDFAVSGEEDEIALDAQVVWAKPSSLIVVPVVSTAGSNPSLPPPKPQKPQSVSTQQMYPSQQLNQPQFQQFNQQPPPQQFNQQPPQLPPKPPLMQQPVFHMPVPTYNAPSPQKLF